MSKWEKPTKTAVNLFNSIIPDDPKIEHRKMFGYPCCFYNNNMFIGLHNNHIVLRMSEVDRLEFIRKYQSHVFEPMPGRQMKEYCVVPESLITDANMLFTWVEKSIEYAKSLPSKPKKKK